MAQGSNRFTFDASNALIVTSGGAGGTIDVNIAKINGSTPSMSNPLPVELSDGSNPFGTASNPLYVAPAVTTTGGATPKGFHISSNAVQAIKGSAGQLYAYFLDNTANSATTYYQFFNVASGSVTLGTTTPLFVIPVPAGLAANLSMAEGWVFGTAMSFAATTTYNGSNAPTSAVDCVIAFN